jgi:hypothetical protein
MHLLCREKYWKHFSSAQLVINPTFDREKYFLMLPTKMTSLSVGKHGIGMGEKRY